jgi:hypothetical protein
MEIGEPTMRSALFLAVFAVASARGGCDPTEPPYDPCEAKRCGDACSLCPPEDPECAETAVVKACDAAALCVPAPVECGLPNGCEGQPCGFPCTLTPPCDGEVCPAIALAGACDGAGACVAPDTLVCSPPPPLPDPCAGKTCGDDCVVEPPCAPLCLMPSILGKCDQAGLCQPTAEPRCEPPPPYDPCAGKGCGEYCDPCVPGTPCPMYFAATACDPLGQCVTAGTFTCEPTPPPPADPCAGKRCGEACHTCNPTAEILCPAVMMYCDVAGACGYAYPVCE